MKELSPLYPIKRFLIAIILLSILSSALLPASNALTVNPASLTVTCEQGQHARVHVTVYANGFVVYASRRVYASTPDGISIEPTKGLVNGSGFVWFNISCKRPGIYVYRLEFTEKKPSGGGVTAVASVASTLRVLVKGIIAYIDFRKLNSTHIAVDVRLVGYGVRNVPAKIIIMVNGTNTIPLYNGTIKVPALVEIPIPTYILKHGGYVHVFGEALGVEHVYRFEVEKPLPPPPPVNVTGIVSISAPVWVVALPPSTQFTVEGRLAVNGTQAPCSVLLAMSVGDTVLRRKAYILVPGSISVNGTVAVNPFTVIPYSIRVKLSAFLSCSYGLVSKSVHSEREVLVIPAIFIAVVALLLTISIAVLRLLARRKH